jgi:hypothetical protein
MNINRHNYEEFFILYVDRELDAESRREVEEFMLQNPDLKDELDVMRQIRFEADTTIVFQDKHELLKQDGFSPITLSNYEEWLVLYTDNELTAVQEKMVDEFIALHPFAETELKQFGATKLETETIVFPDKQSLYRKTEKVRVIWFNWKRVAAAVIFLLAAGLTTAILLNKNSEPTGIVEIKPDDNKKEISNPVVLTKENNNSVSENLQERKEKEVFINTKPDREKTSQPDRQISPAKKDELVINTPDKKSNDLTEPLDIKNNDADAASLKKSNIFDSNETLNKLPKETASVTSRIVYPSNNERPTVDLENPETTELANNKGGLRGFLRKVTRTIEKTTSINATTDDDRLLVGGLAIKLK